MTILNWILILLLAPALVYTLIKFHLKEQDERAQQRALDDSFRYMRAKFYQSKGKVNETEKDDYSR